ncbi:immunoglobulin domain-containing protein [Flavobacterium sp. PLA-1-15]|uniref:immunoglobulin domain-containing protein n=1 Tax=Flavobacterium sp. PLA-1-15 TaxID=3380533 RepID=UPI003B7C96AB
MKQLYTFIILFFMATASYSNVSPADLDCDFVVETPLQNTAYLCNGTTTLSVSATGPMLTYQWYFNSSVISNESSNTLTATVSGTYTCVITEGTCSEMVNFTVTQPADPSIFFQPMDVTVCQGEPVHLSIAAMGENLTYQWYRNNQLIIGADSSIFIITTTTQADTGDYYCVVSSECAPSMQSTVAQVTVKHVAITSVPMDFLGCEGSTFVAYIEAQGTDVSYQLYHNMQPVEGATSNMHIITVDESTAGQYFWAVSTASCPVQMTSFNIFMNPKAMIEAEANQSFIAEQTLADFEVEGNMIKWSATEEINFQELLPPTTPLVDGTTYYAFVEAAPMLCMSDVLAVTAHLELGINKQRKTAIQYFPNPVKNVMNFKAESFISTIELYNMLGQVVLQKNIQNQSGVLNMDTLPQGQYILRVKTLEAEENFKIIKQ